MLAQAALFTGCQKDNAPDTPESENGQNTNSSETNTSSDSNDAADAETTADEPTPDDLTDNLPDIKYDGADYVILTRECCEAHRMGVYVDEITADVVSDAVYDRNLAVEERFDVHIAEPVLSPDVDSYSVLTPVVAAGDDIYDIAILHYKNMGISAANGFLIDTKTIGYTEYDKPWWYQKVNDAYSAGGRYYTLVGMYDLDNYYDMVCTFFNKDMLESLYPGTDLYSVVNEGKWTVDKMQELASAAYSDTNGNGKFEPAIDTFGYAQHEGDSFNYQFAWNQPVTERDADGYPVLAINTERQTEIVDRFYKLLFDQPAIVDEDDDFRYSAFMENRCLFLISTLSSSLFMRDMEQDFGILPLVKFDESQTEYYSHTNDHTSLVGIPVNKSKERMDKAAIILEAMAIEGYKTVRPAVYGVALKSKYVRDDASSQMIDIIAAGRSADFAEIFDDWGMTYALGGLVAHQKSSDWASYYQTNESREIGLINDAVAMYRNVADNAN